MRSATSTVASAGNHLKGRTPQAEPSHYLNREVPTGNYTTLVPITPEMAAHWLTSNTSNRQVRRSVLARYTRDMEQGRWKLTHQGIAFDTQGRLLDGQHRLSAIVKSGVTVPMMVTFGLDPEAQAVVDDHLKRSIGDYVAIKHGRAINTKLSAAALGAVRGLEGAQLTPSKSEQLEFMEQHWEALNFVMDCFPTYKQAVTSAAVRAVMTRAYYHTTPEQLRHFARVMTTGMAEEAKDQTIITVRNWLLTQRGMAGGRDRQVERYSKVSRALYGWLRGETLHKIYPANEELFPLPEEQDQTSYVD